MIISVCGQIAAGQNAGETHAAHGIVRKIAPDRREVTIHHQAIPGYMMEMTMDFPVRKTNDLAGINAGDEIDFTLIVRGTEDWIENIHRVGRVNLKPDQTPARIDVSLQPLKPGDPLPDDELLAENGQKIHFSDFRGRALAFTFFFTRCPLPDFCPLMNRNFFETRQLLQTAPGTATNWELLSISFDPGFDSPSILTNYAAAYRGQDVDHWLFASTPAATLRDLAPRLELMVMRQGGSISHNLRTVVLDPQGRIYRQFDGNEWTPRDLADAIREATMTPASQTSRSAVKTE